VGQPLSARSLAPLPPSLSLSRARARESDGARAGDNYIEPARWLDFNRSATYKVAENQIIPTPRLPARPPLFFSLSLSRAVLTPRRHPAVPLALDGSLLVAFCAGRRGAKHFLAGSLFISRIFY